MNVMPKMNRRSFVVSAAAAGGGLALGFHVPLAEAADSPPEVNAWAVIKPDETVVIRIARSEMGQGTLTGLAQMVAEELGCSWDKVTYEFPTPGENVKRKRVWGDFFTAGSQGIRSSNQIVRKGGAAARMMLVSAAANELKVPATELTVADGVISHKASGKTVTFGKIASAAGQLPPPADADIKLKDPKDWTIIGQPKKRLDTPLKVNGTAIYGIDIRLPGMLYAAIKACPVNGGKLQSYDEAKIKDRKGFKKVVKVEDNAVAVIADSWWRAKTALEAMPINWDLGPNAKVSSASIAAWLKEGLDVPEGLVGNKTGDAKAALDKAAKKVEAVYAYPYQHHVTMEPQNATARYTDEKCEVWTSTQNGEAALALVSETSGLPIPKCEVYKTFLGGGFGRRSTSHDYVKQAVLIAKQMPGTPIKLLWSREEDMIHGWYHPVTQCKLTAGFDENKNLNAMHIRISGQSILATVMPARMQEGRDPATFSGFYPGGAEAAFGYDVPNVLVDHSMRNPHIHPGFWRGVNINHNAIYLECFMDELAKEMGVDALEFRRKNMMKHPRHLAVLNAVAERIGWGTPAPAGIYRGLAQHMGFGSYIAAAAEVSVDGKKVKIHRIVGATDPGYAVNPALIERQIAGSFMYGLTGLFLGGIEIKDGRVVQENFDTYDSMRLAQMPKVESIVMPSHSGVWGGVGEPTICVAPPAVLNAIANATGTRYRTFPLRDHGLTMA
ncbi:MAG TPA: molybdopterin cofactor-binding domain-containing protein [Xanthobacteraceae bacterium]|nr:molybdopterin cofactor-binding domain-containing protein [Xanthobacteraceae bacterium]